MEMQLDQQPKSIALSAYVRVVRSNQNFRRLWMAQIVSEIGDWFYTLAIYSLLMQLTGRASAVALALILQVLPLTFIGPTAGVVNDRVSRKRVMIAADIVRAVIVLSMLLVRTKSTVWLVYPLLLLETLGAAFFEPARTSVIPNITPREDLVVANTISSTTWSVNLVLGAALGGLVGALLGRDAVFVLNGASFIVSALLIRSMKFHEPHTDFSAPLRPRDLVDYTPVLEGIRYVRRDTKLLFNVFVKTGLFVIGPSWVVFTVMGQRDFPVHWFGIDPQRGAMLGMSLLMGARGVGALLGPVFAAPWAGLTQARLRLCILGGYILQSLGYASLGASKTLWLACVCVMFAHCGGSVVWVFSTTLLQLNTDDRFRGRVFAAELGFSMLNIAAGSYLAGVFVDRGVSVRAVATVAGLLMLIPASLWAWAIWRWRTPEIAVASAD